jgi:predicted metal-dependent peptidase
VREGTGEIAIAVDCSGSVNARQLRLFEAEIRSILEGHRLKSNNESRSGFAARKTMNASIGTN